MLTGKREKGCIPTRSRHCTCVPATSKLSNLSQLSRVFTVVSLLCDPSDERTLSLEGSTAKSCLLVDQVHWFSPPLRDHPSHVTTWVWQKGWSHNRGTTVTLKQQLLQPSLQRKLLRKRTEVLAYRHSILVVKTLSPEKNPCYHGWTHHLT